MHDSERTERYLIRYDRNVGTSDLHQVNSTLYTAKGSCEWQSPARLEIMGRMSFESHRPILPTRTIL